MCRCQPLSTSAGEHADVSPLPTFPMRECCTIAHSGANGKLDFKMTKWHFCFFGFINRTQASEHCEMISLRWHNSSDTCGIFPFYKGESFQKEKGKWNVFTWLCNLRNLFFFFTQLQIIFNIFQSSCLSLLVSKMFRTMRRGQIWRFICFVTERLYL